MILASLVYVYHVTEAIKAFLDLYGYTDGWCIVQKNLCKKQGVCISTADSAGIKPINKDMADSLFFWGYS